MTEPSVFCMCPTFNRPEMLASVLQMFLRQTYKNSFLMIYDDSGRWVEEFEGRYCVLSTTERAATIADKYNFMLATAKANESDIHVVMEDDDIYHWEHLAEIVKAYQGGKQFFSVDRAAHTHAQPYGHYAMDGGKGRFHAAWGWTRELREEAGWYAPSVGAPFDLQWGSRLRRLAGGDTFYNNEVGTYVYRWGHGNASAYGDGMQRHYDGLKANSPTERVRLLPRLDGEAGQLLMRIEKARIELSQQQ